MAQMVFGLAFRDRIEMSQIAGGIETAGERVGDLLAQGQCIGHRHSRARNRTVENATWSVKAAPFSHGLAETRSTLLSLRSSNQPR